MILVHSELSDVEREEIIRMCYANSLKGSVAVRRYWWDLMKDEIARRSPEQVEKMEKEKGIGPKPIKHFCDELLAKMQAERDKKA